MRSGIDKKEPLSQEKNDNKFMGSLIKYMF